MDTVLITGANRGIGLRLCREFLAGGWRVFACCREPDRATELQALAGDTLSILPLDVGDSASIAALRTSLQGETIDVLVNNAGTMDATHDQLGSMDYDSWLHTLHINTVAPFQLSEALLPNLRSSARPRIITISSQMGSFELDMGPGFYAYSSSKAAVSKAMQLLSKALREDGIIVCPVHPGWVQTDMGGPNAAITPEASAAGLYRLITGLTPEQSGRFWTWDGREHAW